MASKTVLRNEDGTHIVFDYQPKQIPLAISPAATNFVRGQSEQPTDFKISDLVAAQTGIADLQKASLEQKIEEQSLERLKLIEEKAYQEAYELGLIEGAERAFTERQSEFNGRLEALDQMLRSFEEMKKHLLAENEASFVRFCFQIASRIAMKEIEGNKENIVSIIRQLVEETQSEERITVRLSQEDIFFIESLRERSPKEAEIFQKIKLEGDEHISPGGCVVETNFGSIDATVEERVQRVWATIDAKIPKNTPTGEGG